MSGRFGNWRLGNFLGGLGFARGLRRWVGTFLLIAAGCASPKPSTVDAEIEQLAASGRAAYARGAYAPAVRFYDLALQRARAHDDGPEIARNAYNLAACQLALGLPADARVALREALAEFGRWRMDSQPALLLDAKAAQAAGDTNETQRVLALALAACKSDAQRMQVWLVRGELAVAAGDREGAASALNETEALAAAVEGDAASAERLDLKGQVGLLDGQPVAAAADFDAAAAAAQKAKHYRDMADALGRAGAAYAQAGDSHAAADRLYRAARSRHAQGDLPSALRLTEQGLAASRLAEDAEQQQLLTDLFARIKRAVERARAEAPVVEPP